MTGPGVGRRGALPVLALAVALVAPGRSAAQAPPAPEPVRVAAAFTAAWNAHDLPAVLALFAPDAVVRERRGWLPPEVWDTRDQEVVRDYLNGTFDGTSYNPSNLVLVAGHQEIAGWAAARFALHHRYVVGPSRAAEDTVGWSYLAFVDPHQLLSGGSPAEGEAEAVVRGGRITRLTLVQSPASVQRQQGEVDAALAQAMATRRASPHADGPSVRLSGPPRAASEPTDATWPLALSGLAFLAGAAVVLRRRRPS